MAREDGRTPSQMRPNRIVRNYIKHPEGSVLIAVGDTKVVCTASVEESQPRFMREQRLRNRGWVTAEYSMLPRSTSDRMRPRSHPWVAWWKNARDPTAYW